MANQTTTPQDEKSVLQALLIADHQHVREEYRRNEELGERRLQIFIGLLTAIFGGLALLANDVEKSLYFKAAHLYWLFALLGSGTLTLVGFMTFSRLCKRDLVTDQYKMCLDLIRQGMLALPNDVPQSRALVAEYQNELKKKVAKPLAKNEPRQLAQLALCLTLVCALAFVVSAALFLSSVTSQQFHELVLAYVFFAVFCISLGWFVRGL